MNSKSIISRFIIPLLVCSIIGLIIGLMNYITFNKPFWPVFFLYTTMIYFIQLPLESIKYAYKTFMAYKDFDGLTVGEDKKISFDWKKIADFEMSKCNIVIAAMANAIFATTLLISATIFLKSQYGLDNAFFIVIICNIILIVPLFLVHSKLDNKHIFALGKLNNEYNDYHFLSTIPMQLKSKASIAQMDVLSGYINRFKEDISDNCCILVEEYNRIIDKEGFIDSYKASCLINGFKTIINRREAY